MNCMKKNRIGSKRGVGDSGYTKSSRPLTGTMNPDDNCERWVIVITNDAFRRPLQNGKDEGMKALRTSWGAPGKVSFDIARWWSCRVSIVYRWGLMPLQHYVPWLPIYRNRIIYFFYLTILFYLFIFIFIFIFIFYVTRMKNYQIILLWAGK